MGKEKSEFLFKTLPVDMHTEGCQELNRTQLPGFPETGLSEFVKKAVRLKRN